MTLKPLKISCYMLRVAQTFILKHILYALTFSWVCITPPPHELGRRSKSGRGGARYGLYKHTSIQFFIYLCINIYICFIGLSYIALRKYRMIDIESIYFVKWTYCKLEHKNTNKLKRKIWTVSCSIYSPLSIFALGIVFNSQLWYIWMNILHRPNRIR